MALFAKKQQNTPGRRRTGSSQDRVTDDPGHEQRDTFRRNRTLTGSSSSRVLSSNEANSQLKSPRVQTHELIRRRRHIGAVLLMVIIGAASLFGLISQFSVEVVVRAQEASIRLDPIYEESIQDYLSERPIERLRFLLNTDTLSEHLQATNPEIASIKVDGSAGFGKSALLATLREPIAGWSINGQQHYVDSAGTAFDRNYFATPKVQVIDNSGIQVSSGQAIASNRFLGFIGRAVGLAQTSGYVTQQVIIPADTTRQIELRLEGIPYPIKFSVDRAVGAQVEDMARALTWLKEHSVTPEYLDVRIGGKAFYR